MRASSSSSISSPQTTNSCLHSTVVSNSQLINLECSIRNEINDDIEASVTTLAVVWQNAEFPSFTDTFEMAYPGEDTRIKKKYHAVPRGNVCCKTTKRSANLSVHEFVQMVQEDGAVAVCLLEPPPPEQPAPQLIPVVWILDPAVQDYMANLRVAQIRVINYNENDRLYYQDFGPVERVRREHLDYFGYPSDDVVDGVGGEPTEDWTLSGIFKHSFAYRPYHYTIVPHVIAGSADGAPLGFREEVEGKICVLARNNNNNNNKATTTPDQFIKLAEAGNAAAVVFYRAASSDDQETTTTTTSAASVVLERKLFQIPVFATTDPSVTVGRHKISFRRLEEVANNSGRATTKENYYETKEYDHVSRGVDHRKVVVSKKKNNGYNDAEVTSSRQNDEAAKTTTTTTKTVEKEGSSSSLRVWADSNGVDEYYVKKLENQGARFLDDVAMLYIDSLDPPPPLQHNHTNALNIRSFQLTGVGGLDQELDELFTRAFTTRLVPHHVVRELGLRHTRGVLLHGPPGTGKTLIARELGRTLHAKRVEIVSGPEILSKFLGESEENVRALFAPAVADQKTLGDDAPLHVIVLDEMDAICGERGSGDVGAGKTMDSVVNQFLAAMDGVTELNNVLVIGLTNRLEAIDAALLRPGRFEVQIKIDLPDAKGRREILRLHTKTMRESDRLDEDVDLTNLANHCTDGMSGADLAGLVRSASSLAIKRCLDSELRVDVTDLVVQQDDFWDVLERLGYTIKRSRRRRWRGKRKQTRDS